MLKFVVGDVCVNAIKWCFDHSELLVFGVMLCIVQISVSVSRLFVNGSGEWYISSVTLIANFTRYQKVKKGESGVFWFSMVN